MARNLSTLKRRTNLVDLAVCEAAGVSLEFQGAANFDDSFTKFADVPQWGLRSRTAAEQGFVGSPHRGLTRFLFNPADYTASNSAIVDSKPFWLKVATVLGGSAILGDEVYLVLPYSTQPNRPVVLQGDAPAGNNSDETLELQLPGQCFDLTLQVDGSTDLYLSFEKGGSEFRVSSLQNNFTTFSKTFPAFSQLFIRGAGAPTTFSAVMALKSGML